MTLLFLLLAAGFLVSAATNFAYGRAFARLRVRYTDLSRRHDELMIGDIVETPCQCPPELRGPRPADADPDAVWGCGVADHPYELSEAKLLDGLAGDPEAERAALNHQDEAR